MPMTSKQMIRFLKKNGFKVESVTGSHYKMVNNKTGRQTIVPYHCKDLTKGMEATILKQAGLEKDSR